MVDEENTISWFGHRRALVRVVAPLSWLRLLQWGERRQNLLSLLLGITQAHIVEGLTLIMPRRC